MTLKSATLIKNPKTYGRGHKNTCARKFAPFYIFGLKLGIPKMARTKPKGTQANLEKVRIEVKGKVTKVGFLRRVKELADNLDILGTAKNIDDWVEIYAKGSNENLKKFINEIKKFDGIGKVDSTETYYENQDGYKPEGAPPTWDNFVIYRSQGPEAIWERVDEGIEYLRVMTKTLSCFKGQTDAQFNYLGDKYHIISLSLIVGFALMIILLALIYLKP